MSPDQRSSLERIREAAEQIARNRPLSVPRDDAGQRSLVQELHIHQIELEIQNEELLAAQYALEKARYKYSDLFNNAPVGYLILDPAGFILEANQTFADMAGRSTGSSRPPSAIGSPRRPGAFSLASSRRSSMLPSKNAWIFSSTAAVRHAVTSPLTVVVKRMRPSPAGQPAGTPTTASAWSWWMSAASGWRRRRWPRPMPGSPCAISWPESSSTWWRGRSHE